MCVCAENDRRKEKDVIYERLTRRVHARVRTSYVPSVLYLHALYTHVVILYVRNQQVIYLAMSAIFASNSTPFFLYTGAQKTPINPPTHHRTAHSTPYLITLKGVVLISNTHIHTQTRKLLPARI